jgi:AraC family transcriptional regulator, regulatory protein of adaptative response / methylated-DNA-[protein]-cysteine methyltransferase
MGDLEFYLYKVPSEIGDWLAVFEGSELIYLDSYNQGKKSLEAHLEKFLHTHYHFHIGKFQAAEWTKGNFWTKKHKIKLQGTEFQMKVWLQLLKIPRGTCVTYSDVAKKIRKPKAVRAVGTAIGQNPVCVWIPCHRVIGKDGNILKYRGGSQTKIGLLQKEGALAISKSSK